MVPSNWEKIKVGQKKLHSLNSCNLFEVIQFIPKLLLKPFNMMYEISKVANGKVENFMLESSFLGSRFSEFKRLCVGIIPD